MRLRRSRETCSKQEPTLGNAVILIEGELQEQEKNKRSKERQERDPERDQEYQEHQEHQSRITSKRGQ